MLKKLCELTCRWFLALLFSFALTAQATGTQQLVTQETIEPAIRRHTLQYGPWKADNVELRVLPFPALTIPSGPVHYRVLQPGTVSSAGMHNFYIAAEIAGKEEARLWVKTEIRIFEQVVVAAAPLARHELIGAKDLSLERREILARGNRPFTRIEDVIGKQSTRAIEANEIFTSSSVDRPTLMKRGSAITLVFETGSLRVETAGVAEEGGKIGDLIHVKNPSSGKILRGVVLDRRQVRLN